MQADLETRRRRAALRAMRRGMRETDLLLGPFAARALPQMDEATLSAFEALLEVTDRDLLGWVLGQVPAPEEHAALVAAITAFHATRI